MNIQLVSLLMTHFLCNTYAAQQPMSVVDAGFCSQNFEAAKIRIHPEITESDLAHMSFFQRAEKSSEGYLHYRRWLSDHPDLVVRLKDAADKIASPSTREANIRNGRGVE